MIATFPALKRITNKEDIQVIEQLAREDKHDVISPTHKILKGDKVVGYMSILNVPIILGHLSTKEMVSRDSFSIINIAENIAEAQGVPFVIQPVGLESPFHPLMETMGYTKLANVDLFVKRFV